MPMIANPGGALGWGMQGISTQFGASAIASAAYGGANYAAGEATGFNPLTGVTPAPWVGAAWGAAAGMPWPWQAAGALKEGLFGANVQGYKQSWSSPSGWRHQDYTKGRLWWKEKGSFGRAGSFAAAAAAEDKLTKRQFAGVIGWKTMLIGVHDSGGIWAKMSVGNVGLSAVELIGKTMQAIDPTWASPTVAKMSNARKLGLAGMMNIVEEGAEAAGDLKHGWLYQLAGIDPSDAKYVNLGKKGIKGSVVKISDKLVKKGLHLAAVGTAGKLFSAVGGAFSLWTWGSVIKDTTSIVSSIAAHGFGEAAKRLYGFMGEVNKPDFGRGYIPEALDTRGAATERQRALRAAYSAKISPQNRMYGNEAQYHHSR